jgi:hypothetical protein
MTKTDDRVIKFQAQVIKVQSMADGALRITLDLPEDLINIAALLMESKRQGGLLEIAAVAVKAKNAGKSRKIKTTDDSSATY